MGRATDLKHIQIYVSEQARDVINDHARKLDFVVTTDYIRKLIDDDLKAHGIHIDLEVSRGKKQRGG